MNVNNFKIVLSLSLLLSSAHINASLKDKFKEQKKPKKVVISQEVLDIRDDINKTWNAIRKEGNVYYLMHAKNIRTKSNRDKKGIVYYKQTVQQIFPFALVDNKVFVPISTYVGKSGIYWKGKKLSCDTGKFSSGRYVRFSRPTPVGKLNKDSIVNFKMRYELYDSDIPQALSSQQEFEVNFDTKECFATYPSGKDVHQCHITTFSDFRRKERTNRIYNELYLNKKNLENCKVEN